MLVLCHVRTVSVVSQRRGHEASRDWNRGKPFEERGV